MRVIFGKVALRVMVMTLILTYVIVGCLPIPVHDCGYGSERVVGTIKRRLPSLNSGDKYAPISGAKVEIVSIQTDFDCPGASNAATVTLETDAQGAFDGWVSAYDEDLFTVTMSANGCNPLIFTPTNRSFFRLSIDYLLVCEDTATKPAP